MSEGAGSTQNPRMMTTSNAVLGHLLALIRRRRNLTQAQVAEFLGLAGSTWSRVEKGETPITVEQLRVVADKLNVSPTVLLGLVEQAEGALRRSGFTVGSGPIEKAGVVGAGVGADFAVGFASPKVTTSDLFGGVLPLVGAALGGFLGHTLGSALEKALATKPESPPTSDKG